MIDVSTTGIETKTNTEMNCICPSFCSFLLTGDASKTEVECNSVCLNFELNNTQKEHVFSLCLFTVNGKLQLND